MRLLPLLVLLAACASDPAPLAEPATPGDSAADSATDSAAPEARPGAPWGIDEVTLPGSPGTASVLTGARVGLHADAAPAYDRIVFDVDGGDPKVHVGYVDTPVSTCGSGAQLWPEGDGALEIRVVGAQAHTEAGEATLSHARTPHRQPAIRETVPTCDFEGQVTWVLGVSEPTPFRAFWLRDPLRLVVDVQHP